MNWYKTVAGENTKEKKVQKMYLWYATLHVRDKGGYKKTFMYLFICAKEIQ